MLKIKVFNAKQPTQARELEFSLQESLDREYQIGGSPDCAIQLAGLDINDVRGIIRPKDGKYYFIPLSTSEYCQFNEENIALEGQYPLNIDDTIRFREYVLIIDTVPFSEKPLKERKLTTAIKKTQKTLDNGNNRSLQQLKTRLTPKNTSPSPPPLTPSPSPTSEKDLTLRCVGIIPETHDVKTFRFIATSPTTFAYKAGQFLTLKLNIEGKAITRSYSVSSTPSRPNVLEITVKRVPPPPDVPTAPPGLVSNWLHDNLKAGDIIQTKGISGKFTCMDHPSRKLLLISAGSGITPMMAMSRWVYDTGSDHEIVFFHSARDRQDVIYDRELQLLNERNPHFHLVISLTRSDDPTWQGLTGRLDEKMMPLIAPDYQNRTVYVCGPEAFMKGVKTLLESLAFPMENYHEESFGGTKKVKKEKTSADSSEKNLTLTLAKSGQEITTNGEDTILELAEEAGIEINSSCRGGNCGTCKVRKLEGEIAYDSEPKGLDTAEEAEGYILTCIARPVDRVVIEA